MDELTRLVNEEGFKAVRFNPYLWPKGEKMTNDRGRPMYAKCALLRTQASLCLTST